MLYSVSASATPVFTMLWSTMSIATKSACLSPGKLYWVVCSDLVLRQSVKDCQIARSCKRNKFHVHENGVLNESNIDQGVADFKIIESDL